MVAAESLAGKVDLIVGYEIVKRPDLEDLPVVRSYFATKASDLANPDGFVDALILDDAMPEGSRGNPGPAGPRSNPSSTMSIKILPGNNLYLVRYANQSDGPGPDTRTKWGPGIAPISFLPDNIHGGKPPLRNLRLLYAENGKVKSLPAQNMPDSLKGVPDNAWLAFECDIADMRALWEASKFKAGTPFSIPFRYNLFDRQEETPVWAIEHDHDDDDHDRDHDHDQTAADGGVAGGGELSAAAEGVRPLVEIMRRAFPTITEDTILLTMTHGGIHPGMMVYQFALQVIKNAEMSKSEGGPGIRIHGGIHPSSLVDYFYEGP